MNHGTHTLQLGITARGSTKISELLQILALPRETIAAAFEFEFDCFDAYDAPIDVVMEKSQA